MDPFNQEDNPHLTALCQQLGHLWSPKEVEDWDEMPPMEKVEECKLMLVGKILSNPSINFHAF